MDIGERHRIVLWGQVPRADLAEAPRNDPAVSDATFLRNPAAERLITQGVGAWRPPSPGMASVVPAGPGTGLSAPDTSLKGPLRKAFCFLNRLRRASQTL